jgi:hypothetical protein
MMPAGRAPRPETEPPGVEGDVVDEDEDPVGRDAAPAGKRPDGTARLVHVRLGADEEQPRLAPSPLGHRRLAALKHLGVTDAELVELMAVVDLFSGLNKFLDGLRVESDLKP